MAAATDLPGRQRREGKQIAIEGERESRPDVKAAGRRGEDEECVFRLCIRDTAPSGDEDVLCALFAVRYGRLKINK